MTFVLYSPLLKALYPEIFLGFIAFGMLMMGRRVHNRSVYTVVSIVAMFIAMLMLLAFDYGNTSFFGGAFIINKFGLYFAIILLISSAYIAFSAGTRIDHDPEIFFAILLFVDIAMMIASFSLNLIFIFIAF
jgi:NADH:ubiquinone oxidoreductase subunit 2 (chain N)